MWWSYTTRIVALETDSIGVYELGDKSKNTVYYGKGKIKTRLLAHLNKKECPLARYYRFELLTTEVECKEKERELLEAYLRIHGKLPMYNQKKANPFVGSLPS